MSYTSMWDGHAYDFRGPVAAYFGFDGRSAITSHLLKVEQRINIDGSSLQIAKVWQMPTNIVKMWKVEFC